MTLAGASRISTDRQADPLPKAGTLAGWEIHQLNDVSKGGNSKI